MFVLAARAVVRALAARSGETVDLRQEALLDFACSGFSTRSAISAGSLTACIAITAARAAGAKPDWSR